MAVDPDDRPFAPVCKAQGCPLPADHVTHWWPAERRGERPRPRWGVCDYHRVAQGSEWMDTSRRINDQAAVLRVVVGLRSMVDQECKPLTGERVADWLARVDRIMRARILPGSRPAPSASADDHLQAIKRLAQGGAD